MARRFSWLAFLALAACADKTSLLVEVQSADLHAPADIDSLRFQASTAAGAMADSGSIPIDVDFPHSYSIRPASGGSSDSVLITVTGYQGGVFRVRRVVRAQFVSGETTTVVVVVEAACVNRDCPAGIDCVAGTCVDVPPADGGMPDGGTTDGGSLDGSMRDGGTTDGAMVDAGMTDGGMLDGGTMDAGMLDGGSADACMSTAETCDGDDDDCDGDIDEELPCPGTIVISEVATGGPGGALDEFVELYNPTSGLLRIDALEIEYRSATGAPSTWSRRATVPSGATIAPHGFYLLGASGYTRTPAADLGGGWSSGLAQAGGHVRIVDGALELDKLGWGTAIDPEGAVFPALSDDRTMSYERKANAASTAASMSTGADATRGNSRDTNDNGADFVARPTAGPQSMASAAEMP